MKTVTIPTCANPFVVIINGRKYTYPAGETMEVPDEVAEVIERHEEAHPKPDPAPEAPGGGSCNCPPIIIANSVEEMNAANLPDGTIAMVPSVETVFDISESVNYAKSIMAGGAVQQAFSVEACPQIVEALKKGNVKIKVSIGVGVTIEEFVTGSINEAGNARVISFTIYNGDLLYTDTFFDPVNKRIDYICKQVTTAIYNPS